MFLLTAKVFFAFFLAYLNYTKNKLQKFFLFFSAASTPSASKSILLLWSFEKNINEPRNVKFCKQNVFKKNMFQTNR